MNKTDGGPEFSALGHAMSNYGGCIDWSGMTLRDWFAGQALVGVIVTNNLPGVLRLDEMTAKRCYAFADDMLAERAKTHDGKGQA